TSPLDSSHDHRDRPSIPTRRSSDLKPLRKRLKRTPRIPCRGCKTNPQQTNPKHLHVRCLKQRRFRGCKTTTSSYPRNFRPLHRLSQNPPPKKKKCPIG